MVIGLAVGLGITSLALVALSVYVVIYRNSGTA